MLIKRLQRFSFTFQIHFFIESFHLSFYICEDVAGKKIKLDKYLTFFRDRILNKNVINNSNNCQFDLINLNDDMLNPLIKDTINNSTNIDKKYKEREKTVNLNDNNKTGYNKSINLEYLSLLKNSNSEINYIDKSFNSKGIIIDKNYSFTLNKIEKLTKIKEKDKEKFNECEKINDMEKDNEIIDLNNNDLTLLEASNNLIINPKILEISKKSEKINGVFEINEISISMNNNLNNPSPSRKTHNKIYLNKEDSLNKKGKTSNKKENISKENEKNELIDFTDYKNINNNNEINLIEKIKNKNFSFKSKDDDFINLKNKGEISDNFFKKSKEMSSSKLNSVNNSLNNIFKKYDNRSFDNPVKNIHKFPNNKNEKKCDFNSFKYDNFNKNLKNIFNSNFYDHLEKKEIDSSIIFLKNKKENQITNPNKSNKNDLIYIKKKNSKNLRFKKARKVKKFIKDIGIQENKENKNNKMNIKEKSNINIIPFSFETVNKKINHYYKNKFTNIFGNTSPDQDNIINLNITDENKIVKETSINPKILLSKKKDSTKSIELIFDSKIENCCLYNSISKRKNSNLNYSDSESIIIEVNKSDNELIKMFENKKEKNIINFQINQINESYSNMIKLNKKKNKIVKINLEKKMIKSNKFKNQNQKSLKTNENNINEKNISIFEYQQKKKIEDFNLRDGIDSDFLELNKNNFIKMCIRDLPLCFNNHYFDKILNEINFDFSKIILTNIVNFKNNKVAELIFHGDKMHYANKILNKLLKKSFNGNKLNVEID